MSMLPTVRRQLFEAVERRAQPQARGTLVDRLRLRRYPRLTAGHVTIAALCALPVLIAAGALVVLGAHRPQPSRPAGSHPESARQQLIENFGVLRRAQTPADRDSELVVPTFSGHEKGMVYPKLDQALMRVVRVPRFDAKVAFDPMIWQPSASSPTRTEGLELVMWIGSARTIPPASEVGTGPVAVGDLLRSGAALTDGTRNPPVIDGVMAVPDGVAKVTVRPIRVLRTPVALDPNRFGIATTTVHDNLAAFLLRRPTVQSADASGSKLFGANGVAEVTWFDAAGKVIKRTTTNLDLFARVLGTQAASAGASNR